METSAKDGNNVNKLFCEIGKTLYKAQELKNDIFCRFNFPFILLYSFISCFLVKVKIVSFDLYSSFSICFSFFFISVNLFLIFINSKFLLFIIVSINFKR